jgi:hypothetical protein
VRILFICLIQVCLVLIHLKAIYKLFFDGGCFLPNAVPGVTKANRSRASQKIQQGDTSYLKNDMAQPKTSCVIKKEPCSGVCNILHLYDNDQECRIFKLKFYTASPST